MKPRKFQFRTDKATGRYASFQQDTHIIKLKRLEVGTIGDRKPFKISLSVVNDKADQNCPFKWILLKVEFESLDEAKSFLQRHTEIIIKNFDLFCTEKRIKVEK
tara:strand:+ start:11197 stop:11508 length:312 start_codon:yes stop_codon:yes gene_type:complete